MTRTQIQQWISQVSEDLILREAWLFGSFARNSTKPNDVDILVIVENLPSSFDFQAAREFAKQNFQHHNLPVDLCIFDVETGMLVLQGTEMQRHARKLSP